MSKYQPNPVRRVEIEKPDGDKRPLGISTVIDRAIQQAVKQVQQIVKQKRHIAVDVDLSKFFDRVNHDLLMSLVSRRVHDKQLKQHDRPSGQRA